MNIKQTWTCVNHITDEIKSVHSTKVFADRKVDRSNLDECLRGIRSSTPIFVAKTLENAIEALKYKPQYDY